MQQKERMAGEQTSDGTQDGRSTQRQENMVEELMVEQPFTSGMQGNKREREGLRS